MADGRNDTPKDQRNADRLHDYWTKDPKGLAKWATTDQPWTNLHRELAKYMTDELAKQTATRWFYEVFHFYPGSDKNRVMHGHPPKGKVIGPG